MKRRIRLAKAGMVALAIALASAGGAQAADGGRVVTHSTAQKPGAVIDYWTPKRMRNAEEIAPPISDPEPVLPGTGGIDSTGEPVVIPGSNPGDAYAVMSDSDTLPGNDTTFPQRIHGRVFFSVGPSNFACSGTVVHSPLANLVATAGHCVFDNSYVTNFSFVPGYRDGVAPLGVWPATHLFALSGWTVSESPALDVGMARLAPLSGALIENALGARGIAFNLSPSQVFDIFGYPARPNLVQDGFPATDGYDGRKLIVCNDATFQGNDFPQSLGVSPCWMQHGSSGGGWVINDATVNSVVSHGYCQSRPGFPSPPTPATTWPTSAPNAYCGIFFGPYFGTEVQGLYTTATTDPPVATKKCKKKKKKRKRGKKKKKKKCKKK